MKWNVVIDGRSLEVEVTRGSDDVWRLRKDNSGFEASVVEVEPSVYSILIDGKSYEARIQHGWVDVGRRHFAVEAEDPRALRTGGSASTAEGRKNVAAPMPGKVIRVLVQEGEAVEAGQGLVVVEAMKMQNEMKSPKAGRVAKLSAIEGAAVTAGEVLATIE